MKTRFTRIAAATLLAFSASAAWGQEADTGIVRFDISRFDVTGNTLLPQARVDAIVQPFAGAARDFGDVQRALEALEREYHDLGYNLVQIELPEQELNRGVVQLKVVQTRIGKIRVEGNQHYSTPNIVASLPDLREGQTPKLSEVSAGVRLANENPGKKVALQLQSGDEPDTVNANLKVTDESPWKWATTLDNTGTKETGRTHLGVSMMHANVGGLDHVLSLQYTTTLEKPSQVSVYGAGYHIPLYRLGDSIDLFASYSDVDSGTISAGLLDLQVSGKGTVAGGRYNHNLGRFDNFDAKLVYGIDYKAYKNVVDLNGLNLGNDVTVHPLSVAFVGNWLLADGEAGVSATLMRNIEGGKNGKDADFAKVRIGAPADFSILRLSASYSRAFAREWQFRTVFNAQMTGDSLIPGEQFGAGGSSSVRGFDERAVSNDTGALVNAEVYTPNVCPAGGKWVMQCRLVGFIDAAHTSRNKPLPGEPDDVGIASAGVGVRMLIDKYASLQIDFGRVIDRGGLTGTGSHKVHARLAISY